MDLLDRLESLCCEIDNEWDTDYNAHDASARIRALLADERKRREPVCICDPKYSATDTGCLACFRPAEQREPVADRKKREGVSDGLSLPCSVCGRHTQIDYHATDGSWLGITRDHRHGDQLGVICLECFIGLLLRYDMEPATSIERVDVIGKADTRVFRPAEQQEVVYVEETADFAWNEVVAAFTRIWGDNVAYNDSPVELIYRLRDERDEALRDVQQLHDAALETEAKLEAMVAREAALVAALDVAWYGGLDRDILTAADLVETGHQCKALGKRMIEYMHVLDTAFTAALAPGSAATAEAVTDALTSRNLTTWGSVDEALAGASGARGACMCTWSGERITWFNESCPVHSGPAGEVRVVVDSQSFKYEAHDTPFRVVEPKEDGDAR